MDRSGALHRGMPDDRTDPLETVHIPDTEQGGLPAGRVHSLTGNEKTSVDRYFEKQMQDPEFAAGYARERAAIDATHYIYVCWLAGTTRYYRGPYNEADAKLVSDCLVQGGFPCNLVCPPEGLSEDELSEYLTEHF